MLTLMWMPTPMWMLTPMQMLTPTPVPLKQVDKGKGKAKVIDLNEGIPPQGTLTPLLS